MLLQLTLKFTIWGPQAHYMADDFFIPNPPLMAPPLSVIKIVKYCGVRGGRVIGGAKILQRYWRPLSVIKIVKYCGVWGRWGIAGRQNPTKDNGAPSLSVINIVKYCGVGGEGGILIRGRKNPTQILAPPPSLSSR